MQGLCAEKNTIGLRKRLIAALYSRSPTKNSRIASWRRLLKKRQRELCGAQLGRERPIDLLERPCEARWERRHFRGKCTLRLRPYPFSSREGCVIRFVPQGIVRGSELEPLIREGPA